MTGKPSSARTHSKQDAGASFVKGSTNFRRDTIIKHTKSKMHLRAAGSHVVEVAKVGSTPASTGYVACFVHAMPWRSMLGYTQTTCGSAMLTRGRGLMPGQPTAMTSRPDYSHTTSRKLPGNGFATMWRLRNSFH